MRRRAVLLTITMAAALVVVGGVALAANIDCQAGTACLGIEKADTMTGTNQADDMSGLGGGDTMRGRDGGDVLSGGEGNDDVYAGSGNDPSIEGGAGDDSLTGGAGDDSYVFGQRWGADTITSGEDSGEDTLDFSSLLGSLDVDLNSSAGRDEVYSRAGMLNFPSVVKIENVEGGKARDVLRGNDASNSFFGNGGNDSLVGGDNDDALFGGLGADAFTGGPDNDALTCSDVSDVIDGDVYIFQDGWGQDSITDAAGINRLLFGELTTSVTVNLATGTATSGTNTVTWTPLGIENTTGGSAIESVTGGTAADFLYGNGSVNTLKGQGGDDTIDVAERNPEVPGSVGDPGDTVDCGPGLLDTVYVDAIQDPVTGTITPIDSWSSNCETAIKVY